MEPEPERHPLLEHQSEAPVDEMPPPAAWSKKNQWIVLAIASGACAAFNGVFAKLTTTELTTRIAQSIASLLGLSSVEGVIEFIARCTFFGLNLVFNGVMWTLFTTALARGNSTTQVSIMNTSSNFVVTAVLGFAIFSESLPPLWWLGAAMLVAGNVIIGGKNEGASPAVDSDREELGVMPDDDAAPSASDPEDRRGAYRDAVAAEVVVPPVVDDEVKGNEVDEDILQLDAADVDEALDEEH